MINPHRLLLNSIPKTQTKNIFPKNFLSQSYPKLPKSKKELSLDTLIDLKVTFLKGLSSAYPKKCWWGESSCQLFELYGKYPSEVDLSELISEFIEQYPPESVASVHTSTNLPSPNQQLFFLDDLVLNLVDGRRVSVTLLFFTQLSAKKKEAKMLKIRAMANAVLARADEIALVLLWKRSPGVLVYPLEKRNSVAILEGLKVADATALVSKPITSVWEQTYSENFFIGHHQRKSSLDLLLTKPPKLTRPFQVFLLGNLGSRGEASSLRKMALHYEGRFIGYRAYVHAPYSLSLARELTSAKPGSPTIAQAAEEYLKASAKMGFRGVVFHVDKSPDLKKARANIRKNLDLLCPLASEKCPILLENSCGDGNGNMSSPEEMAEVVSHYPATSLGVCMDICHAHGAGYSPEEYVYGLDNHTRIKLIHFNGAHKLRGCKADGHESFAQPQLISPDEMTFVLDYARERKLSCIIE